MLDKTKIIKQLKCFKDNNIELSVKSLSETLNISPKQAKAEIEILITERFVIPQGRFTSPHGNGSVHTILSGYTITSKCDDYLKTNRTALFLKWYPILVSTIALIVSILVAICK